MIIPPIELWIADGVEAGKVTTHAHQLPASEVIVMDAARSGARFFWTPRDVSRTNKDETTPRTETLP